MSVKLKTVAAAAALVVGAGLVIAALDRPPEAPLPDVAGWDSTYDIETVDARFGDYAGWSGELDAADAPAGVAAAQGEFLGLAPASGETAAAGCVALAGPGSRDS